MIAVGDPGVSRPHNPHVQQLRVPNRSEIDLAALRFHNQVIPGVMPSILPISATQPAPT